MDRIDSIRINDNLEKIVARMNSLESYLEVISDMLQSNKKSSDHLTHSTMVNSVDRDVISTLCKPMNEDPASTDKDLLRRLKRGSLLQFDEPSNEEIAPARKASLIDVFLLEVYCQQLL